MGIGSRLKKLREENGWSLRDVAAKTRVSRQTILRAEHDDIATIQLLLKLINVYKVKGDERVKLLSLFLKAHGFTKAAARIYTDAISP